MARRPITNLPSKRTGLYPSPEFLATCAKMRQAPIYVWNTFEPRCTGEVDWDLPLRPTSLQKVAQLPVIGLGIQAAAGLVPGGGLITGALGIGGAMNGGFEQPIGIGIGSGVGVGICPPGTRCLGPSAAGICLGTCVQSQITPQQPYILPGQPAPLIPAGGLPTGAVDPYTGQLRRRRRKMNYSNQKALRRSLRRATGYARQQKAVRKAAQEFAREFGPKRSPRARRDLPRGHTHVR